MVSPFLVLKVSMLQRSLPTRLASIAMVAESSKMNFKNLIASIKAETFWHKISDKPSDLTPAVAFIDKTKVNDGREKHNRLKI